MRQGRFIITAAAAVAALAIGPASALATPGSFTDDTYADFAAGHVTNAWTVEPGEVRLLRTTALGTTNFDAMPPDWAATPWSTGGTGTVSGGTLTVDGAAVHDNNALGGTFQWQTLEFRATFSGDDFQHVGLGNDFANPPWAMFSTGPVSGQDTSPTDLYARTLAPDGTTHEDQKLPANIDPSAPHLYRIDWAENTVIFSVDGQSVFTSTVQIPNNTMRPVASDATVGGGAVKVDWFSLGSYSGSGGFESRVFDAGPDPDITWGALIASAHAGSPLMETRTGNTPNPDDGTWSQYQGLSGNVITSPRARFIQYRTTGLTEAWPSLEKVTIEYNVDTSSPSTGGSGSGGSGGGGQTGGGNSSADKTAPKATLVAKSLRVKNGAVSFTVGCPATEKSCTIKLSLKSGLKTVASKTVTVKGGKTKTVSLSLNSAAKKLLKKRSSLTLSAVLTATDAAGNHRTTNKKVTLRR